MEELKWELDVFNIAFEDGPRSVHAFRSGSLGLHYNHPRGQWIVDHIPTGLSIGQFERIRHAKEFAARITPLTDWEHATKASANADPELRQNVDAIREELESAIQKELEEEWAAEVASQRGGDAA